MMMKMSNLAGRRFIFGLVAVVCITVTTVMLKYDGETYIKLIGTIAGLFLTAQTVTDSIKINKKEDKPPA